MNGSQTEKEDNFGIFRAFVRKIPFFIIISGIRKSEKTDPAGIIFRKMRTGIF